MDASQIWDSHAPIPAPKPRLGEFPPSAGGSQGMSNLRPLGKKAQTKGEGLRQNPEAAEDGRESTGCCCKRVK